MQDKLGFHFITGLESTILHEHEKKLLGKIQPLGLIFFARNFASPKENPAWKETFLSLIKQALEASEGSIRILSIDYEGGRVHRFPDTVKKFPYARIWKNETSAIAQEMKDILKSFSLNMTYCPVLDVDFEKNNPVIGPRSFSSDPQEVIQSALDFFRVMNDGKIITCGKHFPGHGRTTSDSHYTLPVVNCSEEELQSDIEPFRVLVKEGIPCIMSAHVMYPALDKKLPASLSEKILKDLLRKQLDFDGIVITDDMDMKALAHIDSTEKSRLALAAGTDIILVGNGMDGRSLSTTQEIITTLTPHLHTLGTSLEVSRTRIKKLLKSHTSPTQLPA